MALGFECFFLYTSHKEQLVNFLTQVFDIEMKTIGAETSFAFNNVDFKIIETHTADCATLRIPPFQLSLDTQDEMELLRQKLEFYFFRNHIDSSVITEFSEQQSKLQVQDPDGREWIVSIKNTPSLALSVKNPESSVRMF